MHQNLVLDAARRERRELRALPGLEALDRLDQPDRADRDQVLEVFSRVVEFLDVVDNNGPKKFDLSCILHRRM